MKKASDVFKSIRFAKSEPRGKSHSSTDNEEHYAVGEKEYEQQLKHVKKMAMQEEVKDKYDEGEYDREGDMAKSDLRSIIDNAKRLHDMIDDADNLPEWVQSKITKAEDYISTVANYMTSEMNEEYISESGGDVVFKKGDHHIEKYGEDAFALYKNGKKQKYYTSINAAKSAMNEDVEYLEEKNAPTNPELWSRAKALAKSKFDVYPSAYANGWAAKWYKSKGGGWKTVSEEVEQLDEMPGANMDTRAVHAHLKKKGWSLSRTSGGHDVYTHPEAEHHIAVPRHRQLKAPLVKGILKQSIVKEEEMYEQKDSPPFEGPYTKKSANVTDKSGAKHTGMSRAKHLAKQAMQKQTVKLKKPRLEEEKDTELTNKTNIVRDALKNGRKKVNDANKTAGGKDKFEANPELTSQIVKT